jgi:hypothetical protein
LIEESGDAAVKAGVALASTHGGKRLIDDKLAGSDLNLRGHGHEVERGGCLSHRKKREKGHIQQEL